jgi:hypothetical protein
MTAQVAFEVNYQNSMGNDGKMPGQAQMGGSVTEVVGTPIHQGQDGQKAEPEFAPAAPADQQNPAVAQPVAEKQDNM